MYLSRETRSYQPESADIKSIILFPEITELYIGLHTLIIAEKNQMISTLLQTSRVTSLAIEVKSMNFINSSVKTYM